MISNVIKTLKAYMQLRRA